MTSPQQKRRYKFATRLTPDYVEGGILVWEDVTDGPNVRPVPIEKQVRMFPYYFWVGRDGKPKDASA